MSLVIYVTLIKLYMIVQNIYRFDPREISILPTTKNGPRFLGPPPHNTDGPPPLTHLTPMMLGPPQNTRA